MNNGSFGHTDNSRVFCLIPIARGIDKPFSCLRMNAGNSGSNGTVRSLEPHGRTTHPWEAAGPKVRKYIVIHERASLGGIGNMDEGPGPSSDHSVGHPSTRNRKMEGSRTSEARERHPALRLGLGHSRHSLGFTALTRVGTPVAVSSGRDWPMSVGHVMVPACPSQPRVKSGVPCGPMP